MQYLDRVTISKAASGGDDDPWGGGGGEPTTKEYRCRIDYSSRIVKDQNGNEVVSNVHIRFPGIVSIDYADELIWNDLADKEKERRARPISYKVARNTDYRPLMTVVDL